jgi:patatin-related protein
MADEIEEEAVTPPLEPLREFRLAVVMYGGSSLAIYINGVAQELLSLVKATAPASREAGETEPLLADGELGETQRVYRKLAQLIGPEGQRRHIDDVARCDPIRARFVVDIITGTSAGGINGIFLAKALAGERSMDQLKDLWVREGDIGLLINDKSSSRGLGGVTTKNPPRSLLNGDRMYWKLLKAFEDMDAGLADDGGPAGQEPTDEPREINSRLVEQLDLYVTATDMSGLVLPMKLTDEVISEPRHRNVYHFIYSSAVASGEYRHDLKPLDNPFLAFAARCTSSLPFVFEPMQLKDIDDPTHSFPRFKNNADVRSDSPLWHRFFRDYLVRQQDGTFTSDFPDRAFGDGGSLDNSPFSYATDSLNRRRSDLPVDRKLLYVEPDPKAYETGMRPKEPPDAIANVLEQMFLLPRTQTIREDLDRIITRNRQIQRIRNVLKPLQEDVDRVYGDDGNGSGPTDDPNPRVTSTDVRSRYLDSLLSDYCVSYGAYQRLRVGDVTDDIARLFTKLAGLNEESDDFIAVRYLVRAWRDRRYQHFAPDEKDPVARRPFSEFLVDFDTGFAMRRLHYLREALDRLLAGDGSAQLAQERATKGETLTEAEVRDAALQAKRLMNESVTNLRTAERTVRRRDPDRNPVFASFEVVLRELRDSVSSHVSAKTLDIDSRRVAHAGTETLRRGLVDVLLEQRTDTARVDMANYIAASLDRSFEEVMSGLRDQISPVVDQVDDYLTSAVPDDLAETAVRRRLSRRYEDFVYYDLLAYPLQSGTDAGETDVVEIYRVSPMDARGLIDVTTTDRKKVAGALFGHFGAFFDALWRKNDIMWGRLDGAERLIQAMVPQNEDYDDNVASLREDAYRAILWSELSDEDVGELNTLISSVLASLPPESRTTKNLLDYLKEDGSETLDERFQAFLGALLDTPEALVDYYRTTYTLEAELPQPQTLKNAGRATHITGQVLKGVAQDREAPLVSPMAWVARIGRLFTGAVEAATPGKLLHSLTRHWLVIAYIVEAILILGGSLLSQPAAQQLGWSLLWITIAVTLLLVLLQDMITGNARAFVALRGVVALLFLAAVGMVILEWRHLGTDLDLANRSFGAPPELPLQSDVVARPRAWIFGWGAAALGGAAVMYLLGRGLRVRPVVRGIVSFELAGTRARSHEIMTAWRRSGRARAWWNLSIDFAFVLVYTMAFYVTVSWGADVLETSWQLGAWLGFVLAWMQVAAGVLDVIENLCLLVLLDRWDLRPPQGTKANRLPFVARIAAELKFFFLILGSLYAVAAAITYWVR